jgi:anti-anti-sigma factor
MCDPQRGTRAWTRPVVVALPAEVDISNAEGIGEALRAAFAPGVRTVIADMTGTRFCDSTGISMLVLAHRKALANHAELRVVALSTAVLSADTRSGPTSRRRLPAAAGEFSRSAINPAAGSFVVG